MADDPLAPRAFIRRLRSHWTLALRTEDRGDPRVIDTFYVLDPASNRLLFALPSDIQVAEAVLFVPDDGWDVLEILAALSPLNSASAPEADRFLAAHPGAEWPGLWAALPLSAKHGGSVAGGEDLGLSFPWLARERELRRTLNADRPALARGLTQALGRAAPECIALSLDPDGILFRTRLGPVRLNFASPCETFEAAQAEVDCLLKDITP